LCAIVGVVASGYQQELKLLLSKLNQMDAKIDHFFRKLNVVLNSSRHLVSLKLVTELILDTISCWCNAAVIIVCWHL